MKKQVMINRLVRDRIPEQMRKEGHRPFTRILDDKEYMYQLHVRLGEEVKEYLATRNMEELADVVEVVEAIARARGVTLEEVEGIRKMKAQRDGTFMGRVFLEHDLTEEEEQCLEEAENNPAIQLHMRGF